MENINLEKILKENLKDFNTNSFYGFSTLVNQEQKNLILKAMKEACEKSLELASEEAEVRTKAWYYENDENFIVDKESILNIKERII